MSEYKLNDLITKMIEESESNGYKIAKESNLTQHTTSVYKNKKRPANWKNFLKYCEVLGYEIEIKVKRKEIKKLYQFARKGLFYIVIAQEKESARKKLKLRYNVDIKNCFEISKDDYSEILSNGDKDINAITIDFKKLIFDDESRLVATNDKSIVINSLNDFKDQKN